MSALSQTSSEVLPSFSPPPLDYGSLLVFTDVFCLFAGINFGVVRARNVLAASAQLHQSGAFALP
jgi:hypothetical protein